MEKPFLIALGGNALQTPASTGSFADQYEAAASAMRVIADLAKLGHPLVLTHGNGPQSGALLLQHEAAKDTIAPQPLHTLVAMTQGQIGYTMELALRNAMGDQSPVKVSSCVTLVEVDPADPAFDAPTKPVGPFYSKREVAKLPQRGITYKEDAGRGYRRVVASPRPQAILAAQALAEQVARYHVLIAGGGGGVPVVQTKHGWQGVDAVIDKDYTSMLLAASMGIDQVIILTGVPEVYIDYGTKKQRALRSLTVTQGWSYVERGQFGSGSMEPKIRAALEFVAASRARRVMITDTAHLTQTLRGKAGTVVLG